MKSLNGRALFRRLSCFSANVESYNYAQVNTKQPLLQMLWLYLKKPTKTLALWAHDLLELFPFL